MTADRSRRVSDRSDQKDGGVEQNRMTARPGPGFRLRCGWRDEWLIASSSSSRWCSSLPLFIFGQVKRGVTPETNAVETMMLGMTLLLLFVGQLILTWQARRAGRRGSSTMAEVVAES
jgi:hypothetical protein